MDGKLPKIYCAFFDRWIYYSIRNKFKKLEKKEKSARNFQEQLIREKKDTRTMAAKKALASTQRPNRYEVPPRRK